MHEATNYHRDMTEHALNNSFPDIKQIIVKRNNKEFINSSYFFINSNVRAKKLVKTHIAN